MFSAMINKQKEIFMCMDPNVPLCFLFETFFQSVYRRGENHLEVCGLITQLSD